VGGQHHAPAGLPPGKTRYPLYRRRGGPQNRSGRVRKISPPPGFDPRPVQPVVSRMLTVVANTLEQESYIGPFSPNMIAIFYSRGTDLLLRSGLSVGGIIFYRFYPPVFHRIAR
jgi:hypothetical protein